MLSITEGKSAHIYIVLPQIEKGCVRLSGDCR